MKVPHIVPLPPAVDGTRREFDSAAGRLSWYVAGEGPPLLLIHSINACGSAFEVKPIFERMRASHRVYALDLPGFGFSDRRRRRYDIPLYVTAIREALRTIEAECGPRPVEMLALSLSCEFAARAATERPERVASLTLVTPTGFDRRSATVSTAAPGTGREVPALESLLKVPLWNRALFDLLTSRPSIRLFLNGTFGSKDVDPALVEYDWSTSHQPDAQYAVHAFVCGRLFARDIRAVYERLAMPVWLVHGTRGSFVDFSQAGWARARSNWTIRPMQTGALPHFEQPETFVAEYRRFLEDAALRATVRAVATDRPSGEALH